MVQMARGSSYALYPNLTSDDPVWRALNRDQRFRVALLPTHPPDLANGARLYAQACAACHGANLNKPVSPEYPKLAGQHADYIYWALRQYDLSPETRLTRWHDLTFEGGYRALHSLFAAGLRPRAVFAGNDQMAVGALHAAHELGLTVPADLAIETALAEPVVCQPRSMHFDERGRLWVVQYLQ